MQPQILLAVADEERRLIYETFIKNERVICHTVSSLRDVANQAARQPYNAIFLDMPLMVKASRYEKSLVEDALHAMPNARLNIAAKTQKIRMLISWDDQDGARTPEEHLRYCCEQPPKVAPICNRVPLNLNAVLSCSPDMTDAERTVCIDFSAGGCFLFCVNDEIALQSTVWIRLVALSDPTPIASTICWKREWGMTSEIPGVGVRFDVMTPQQQAEILSLCRGKLKK
ncbi:PilZ domain-containing protein [Oryzomonas rubra]|uniref:PilZ domain-containing protein n=1 Tax=Oryzomonas rubra TaxID=2509454 RepID=A0A5A9XUY9_9BACT|nr:PilZ domain-containing protein [Oryzomonas rubra]KAA0895411.1 PilZ domain-containing protein [Oryzomonas rubra]